MDFDALVDELVARGAEDNSTRNGVWINLAYQEIVNGHDWVFTEDFALGSAGTGIVAVADFRKATFVGDTTDTGGAPPGRFLHRSSFAALARDGAEDISYAGTPSFWWLQAGTPPNIVGYPRGGQIYVRYHFRTPDLATTDEPIFDAAYHYLIVDRAYIEVLKDNGEDDAAIKKMQFFERGLAKMVEEYAVDSTEHDYIDIGDPYDG